MGSKSGTPVLKPMSYLTYQQDHIELWPRMTPGTGTEAKTQLCTICHTVAWGPREQAGAGAAKGSSCSMGSPGAGGPAVLGRTWSLLLAQPHASYWVSVGVR